VPQPRHPFHIVLLGFCLVHLAFGIWSQWQPTVGITGLLYGNGTPVGGDFINVWSVAQLVLEGRSDEIYRPDAFMAHQIGVAGAPIGFRVWAYAPHSLFLAAPFGLVGYYWALAIWSVIGVIALAWGCRRLGLDAWEAAIVILSPASVLCLYYGQTGNLATGLLLLALSARPGRDLSAIGAAAILTIKPQMGIFLPFFWLVQRRWTALIWTSAATLLLVGLSVALFGVTAWVDYATHTLEALSRLERHGTGPFMAMVPSIFMALRILTGNGDLAIQLHILIAIPIVLFAILKLWRLNDPVRRAAVVLVATMLATPYLHNYDLGLLAVGALLVMRRFPPGTRGELAVAFLAGMALLLPQLVMLMNQLGWPLAPLFVLPLLFLA
jgi:hypothetical protein